MIIYFSVTSVRSGKGVYHLKGHRSEVCGLRWSPDGLRLASGGNDNAIYVWHSLNIEPTKFLYRFTEHTAAVRALAWCPLKKNRLASGGGTADRCIKLWNTETGTCAKTTETGSQVMHFSSVYISACCIWQQFERGNV